MKIVLVGINAKYIHSNLAIQSIKSFAREFEETVEIAEYTINHYEDYILEEIYKKSPDVLMFSCYIWNIGMVKNLITDCKKIMPKVPIWVGGPEVSYDAPKFLGKMEEVKGVLLGEGEETFYELAKAYYDFFMKKVPFSLHLIKGICYRKEDQSIITNPPREILNMDTLVFSYKSLEEFENRIIYYESSRGCPFSCSYCLSSIEKKVRFKSVPIVKKELDFFLENKVKQVKFVDRTFNCNSKHALAIWEYLIEKDNGITNFHFEISADLLSEEELQVLSKMRPGLVQFEIGVQSVNDKTIDEIKRFTDFEKLKKNVLEIQKGQNIHQHLDLIAGLPYEDFESFKNSFRKVYEMRPQQLQLGFLKVLKGSYMYQEKDTYGITYKDRAPYEVLFTKWVNFEEMLKLKMVEEMVEVYYNSGQFTLTIFSMEKHFEDPFTMYLQLGEFYETHNYTGMNHGRLKRYEILLEFLEENNIDLEELAFFKEVMTFDLYRRENMKSRPSFSLDLQEYKPQIREMNLQANRKFNTKQVHIDLFHKKFVEALIGYKRSVYKEESIGIPEEWNTWNGWSRPEAEYFFQFDYEKKDWMNQDVHVTLCHLPIESKELEV